MCVWQTASVLAGIKKERDGTCEWETTCTLFRMYCVWKMLFINNALLNWRFSYHQQHSNAHSQLTAVHGHIDSVGFGFGFGWRRLFIHIHIQYEWYLWFGSFTENTKDLSNSNKPSSCSYCQRNHCHCRHSLFLSSMPFHTWWGRRRQQRWRWRRLMDAIQFHTCNQSFKLPFFPLNESNTFLDECFPNICIMHISCSHFTIPSPYLVFFSIGDNSWEKDRKRVCASRIQCVQIQTSHLL